MDANQVDIKQICRRLIKLQRYELAGILKEHWQTRLRDYAQTLWKQESIHDELEPELLEALNEEFLRIGASNEESKQWLDSLKRTRVIQTATHLTGSEGPTFMALHELALMGIPDKEYYLVGAFSGIPYANSAWSGCLNLSNRLSINEIISDQAPGFRELQKAEQDRSRDSSERRISLIPGNLRDASVYQSKISKKQHLLLPFLCKPLLNLCPYAQEGDSFSVWASKFCRNQAEKLFSNHKVVYFDFNEMIRNYLVRILPNQSHPLTRILLDRESREEVLSAFGHDTLLFSINASNSRRIKIETLRSCGDELRSPSFSCKLEGEWLIKLLKNGTLCPGLFLSFSVISFINGITCLGSFEQIEYLSQYQQIWNSIQWISQEKIQNAKTKALSSGKMIDIEGNPIYPLEILIGVNMEKLECQTFGDWMIPLFPRLGLNLE